jgi:hypothetical protein
MQVGENPFPTNAYVNMLELSNPKVLIRSDQAEKAKGKNVIIGEQRPDKKVLLEKIPKASVKTSTLGGQGKTEETSKASAGLTGVPDRSD